MSLRSKIIFLFGLLAIIPLLVLAGFSYGYARSLLREAIQDQLRHTSSVVAEDMGRARGEIELGLDALAAELSRQLMPGDALAPEPLRTATFEAPQLAALADSLLPGATFVGVQRAFGPLAMLKGSLPAEPARCSDGGTSRLLEFTRDVDGWHGGATLVSGYWASDLVTREGRSRAHGLAVVDRERSIVLYADRCEGVVAGDRLDPGVGMGMALSLPGVLDAFRFREGGESMGGIMAPVPGADWGVVATASLDGLVSPLGRLAATYWIFVLGLGISTSLAFYILIGRFTRSLSELARAAEEIGLGELDPWLPMHTSGELGQLTQAFSGMLARIRQMMAQVDQSGRLAVVGQLSAYLAHEIRNPLSSIKLNLQRLRRWTRSGDIPEFCLEPLEISLREVERLNASVSGVLQLSRSEESPRELVSLHHLVEEAADLLASKFRRQGVGLILDLDAEADRVLARVGQVKSAVLNLMVNALEAQPQGGRLEIRSELARAPEMGGPVVSLHFRDHGSGVPPEIRDRIFEPFFTTKAGGSGIGLAMASQAVRDNGGELQLAPSFSVTRGADFVVVFPLASLEASLKSPHPPRAGASRTLVGSPAAGARGKTPDGAAAPGGDGEGSSDVPSLPTHLLSPEGLRAVLALSRPGKEEVN